MFLFKFHLFISFKFHHTNFFIILVVIYFNLCLFVMLEIHFPAVQPLYFSKSLTRTNGTNLTFADRCIRHEGQSAVRATCLASLSH